MKTIQTPFIITGIRAKVDGSLGISATTPELTKEEKVEFMELQNLNLEALFKPIDEKTDIKEIKGELDDKTPSQRLRARMFVYYKSKNEDTSDFNNWYSKQIDKVGRQYLDNIDIL
jgi:hypothetical protein